MNYLKYLDITKENFGSPKKCWLVMATVREFAEANGITPREYLSNLYKERGIEITEEKMNSVNIDEPFFYPLIK